jgi:ferredoxin-NADP reductase/Fe-S-cluster-containing hydrogenase component 2
MGFPMEMGSTVPWIVSHKPIAVEAGLGHMGIHRNLIHPKFGNFVLLGTVLVDVAVDDHGKPIDYNPCLECKLCVAACPVGAIGPDGSFNFSSCLTHNYRDFLGGFSDWIEQAADSRGALEYRERVSDGETLSMWQSLAFAPNYNAAYCLAVCPAGEDVIGPYLQDKQRHLKEIVRPLQSRAEPVYVVEGSDAEEVARRKFKNKTLKTVANGIRPRSIAGLLSFMPIVFQPNQSKGLNATFHFIFTGTEEREVTVKIKDRTIDVADGLVGKADIRVTADANTWLSFLARETSLPLALLRRKVRLKGDPRLLLAFGKCFPSASHRRKPTEIVPETSLMKPKPAPYRRNDPATAKIRWQGRMVLAETEAVTHNVRTFRFKPKDGGSLPFSHRPGQFLTLTAIPGGVPTRRSYTIASSPTWHDRVEITVKREEHGAVSRWLHDDLKPGDEVEIESPNGVFTFSGVEADGVVLIAGGVGVTPMMSIARYLVETDWAGDIHLVLGFRTEADAIFRDEIAALQARSPNLHVTATLSRADASWGGRKGKIDAALLNEAVPGLGAKLAYVCGPTPMMDAVKTALRGLGVPEARIRMEAFGTEKRDPTKRTQPGPLAGKVLFQSSNENVPLAAGATVLDAADEAGIFIDNACRSGTCGACRVRLISGDVRMPIEDALTDEDKADGYILACQAEIRGDVAVDA